MSFLENFKRVSAKYQYGTISAIIGAFALVSFIVVVQVAEHQLPVMAYKLTVVAGGGALGVLFDLVAFAHGGELRDQKSEIARAAVLLRRGIVVSGMALACAMAM